MKRSELKALIAEVISELNEPMINSPVAKENPQFRIVTRGGGMYRILDQHDKVHATSITWKGIKEKWEKVTGQRWVEEPYDS
mgnify:CR=1 FL=1